MGERASVSPVYLLDSVSGDTQPEFEEEQDETTTLSSSRPSTPRHTSRPDTPAPLPGRVELDTLPSPPATSVPETPAYEIPNSPGSSFSGTATDIPGPSSRPDAITPSTSTGTEAELKSFEPKEEEEEND